MNCNRVRDIIATDYIDQELDERTLSVIENHLRDCATCRAYKEALVAVAVNPLRGQEIIQPPAGLWIRIQEELARGKTDTDTIDLWAALTVFHRQWLNAALVFVMLLCTILAGNYCVTNILHSASSYPVQATVEFANNLELTEFSDMPNEQVESVYADMIGG